MPRMPENYVGATLLKYILAVTRRKDVARTASRGHRYREQRVWSRTRQNSQNTRGRRLMTFQALGLSRWLVCRGRLNDPRRVHEIARRRWNSTKGWPGRAGRGPAAIYCDKGAKLWRSTHRLTTNGIPRASIGQARLITPTTVTVRALNFFRATRPRHGGREISKQIIRSNKINWTVVSSRLD